MKTLAIITEYNPYHNGHRYQIKKAKEITGADFVICIMSGNFIQRGEPAILDKYKRAQTATMDLVDLVIELPFAYATGSAYDFCNGAINILNSLNTVDYLCFGTEADSLDDLLCISDALLNESASFKDTIKKHLRDGLSYPLAKALALESCYGFNAKLIQNPNNILAIEYICSLKRINSKITPIAIKRIKANYHDTTIASEICSATAIRNSIDALNQNNNELKKIVPDFSYRKLIENYNVTYPILLNDMTNYLQYCLFNLPKENIVDGNNALMQKIKKLPSYVSYTEACDNLKSKEYTMSRIKRFLLHYIFDYTESMRDEFIDEGYAFYANILSFKKEKSSLIKELHNNSSIKLITKKSDFADIIKTGSKKEDIATMLWNLDIKATNIYNTLVKNKYNTVLCNDLNITLPIS